MNTENTTDTNTGTEFRTGEKIAGLLILAIVLYLFIAQ